MPFFLFCLGWASCKSTKLAWWSDTLALISSSEINPSAEPSCTLLFLWVGRMMSLFLPLWRSCQRSVSIVSSYCMLIVTISKHCWRLFGISLTDTTCASVLCHLLHIRFRERSITLTFFAAKLVQAVYCKYRYPIPRIISKTFWTAAHPEKLFLADGEIVRVLLASHTFFANS